ncbi:flagellar hook basal-body protein [Deferribacter autotrophicus]|uniref:Flagellar hook basal-body protein n=1 Tax=Deferribacter autotrophicus TaxID=500465 RepID=A0A5A8F1T0_9BACT|nr:flagellar hook basal-body protein [Deferribacter autotrophicus]KAA0256836.1 flagellar hook basal-body protein [Deferribacter autotrophicus]
MIKGLYSALSALNAATVYQENTANNIANVNTPGYKKIVTYNQELSKDGVKVYSLRDTKSPGYLIYTGRNLDLAINGNGYFKLADNNGEVFTRNGNFKMDKDGNIVDSNGRILLSIGKTGEVRVAPDGTVYIDKEPLGKIEIFSSSGKKIPENSYEILPGYLEASNVDMAREIVNMIVNQRYFQANMKSIKTADEMLGTIIDNLTT